MNGGTRVLTTSNNWLLSDFSHKLHKEPYSWWGKAHTGNPWREGGGQECQSCACVRRAGHEGERLAHPGRWQRLKLWRAFSYWEHSFNSGVGEYIWVFLFAAGVCKTMKGEVMFLPVRFVFYKEINICIFNRQLYTSVYATHLVIMIK